jgi:DNA-directed RNA polymerase
MYPLSLFLHPQAADHGRSLLEFAEGKPVKSKEAIKWFKVHGANCYGKDKLSIADRVAWVDDSEDMIKRIAENPYENTEWLEADDKETWRFLAFCFDYAAWLADPENHLSHLPVSVDGKCNGLQHYSAMLRDKDGGKAVALTKSTEAETPVDIYLKVADLVNERVQADAAKGNEIAKLWLNDKDEGKVDRRITKKPVMTYPYGASREKTRKVIRKTVKKIEKEHKEKTGEEFIKPVGKLTRGDAIKYMRDVVIEVTGDTVKSAKKVMDWLKAVATIPALFDYPGWVSPIGFHVSHTYYEQESKKIKTTSIKGVERQISSRRETRKLKHRDMTKALPPNFVHSLDASHLMMTVLKCKEAGINSFGMVHDSYATHAADMPAMSRLLRHAFVELYAEQDVLADFRDEIIRSLDPDHLVYETGKEEEVTIPWGDGTVTTHRESARKQIDPEEYLSEIESKLNPLVKGDLDLDEIIDSVYFFS